MSVRLTGEMTRAFPGTGPARPLPRLEWQGPWSVSGRRRGQDQPVVLGVQLSRDTPSVGIRGRGVVVQGCDQVTREPHVLGGLNPLGAGHCSGTGFSGSAPRPSSRDTSGSNLAATPASSPATSSRRACRSEAISSVATANRATSSSVDAIFSLYSLTASGISPSSRQMSTMCWYTASLSGHGHQVSGNWIFTGAPSDVAVDDETRPSRQGAAASGRGSRGRQEPGCRGPRG